MGLRGLDAWVWLAAGDHGCSTPRSPLEMWGFLSGNGKNGIELLRSDPLERRESPQLPQRGLGCLGAVCLQSVFNVLSAWVFL